MNKYNSTEQTHSLCRATFPRHFHIQYFIFHILYKCSLILTLNQIFQIYALHIIPCLYIFLIYFKFLLLRMIINGTYDSLTLCVCARIWMAFQLLRQQDVYMPEKRTKTSLSIIAPLDVLRQRLLLEIARRQMRENSIQVNKEQQNFFTEKKFRFPSISSWKLKFSLVKPKNLCHA